MPNKVQFTPYLVSFYPNINLDYLGQNTDNKWYCKQVPADKDKPFDAADINRGIKTSQTSASLIFYDENKDNLFSKLPSDEKTHPYPYGFIWNTDNNIDDECIFCQVDGHTTDHDFTDKKGFKYVNGINLYKKYETDHTLEKYRGKLANIMKFARQLTIDLAKKVYNKLNSNLLSSNKIDIQTLNDVMNERNEKRYHWLTSSDLEQVDDKWCYKYLLYEALNGNSRTSSATNIVFHPGTRQMSFNMYNEIAIKSHDGRMYFDNLCVNIEAMNALLNVQHQAYNKNIENFQSFIEACLKTGGKDVVVFRNKNEQDLANNTNNKFWLKSSPLIKKKITFLEFIDKYCEKFKQYFTEKQRQQIEELRKEKMNEKTNKKQKENLEIKNNNLLKDEENSYVNRQNECGNNQLSYENSGTNNNISLFGLGCYKITKQEQDGHSCGYCFW